MGKHRRRHAIAVLSCRCHGNSLPCDKRFQQIRAKARDRVRVRASVRTRAIAIVIATVRARAMARIQRLERKRFRGLSVMKSAYPSNYLHLMPKNKTSFTFVAKAQKKKKQSRKTRQGKK